jgi:hypothetical protein
VIALLIQYNTAKQATAPAAAMKKPRPADCALDGAKLDF